MQSDALKAAIDEVGRQFQRSLANRGQGDNVILFCEDLLSDCPGHYVVLYFEECLAKAIGPGAETVSSTKGPPPGFRAYAAGLLAAATAGFNGELRQAKDRVGEFLVGQDPRAYGANLLEGDISVQVLPGPIVEGQLVTAVLFFRGQSGLTWSSQWVRQWQESRAEKCEACGQRFPSAMACGVPVLAFPRGSATKLNRIPYGQGIRAEEDTAFAKETGLPVFTTCPDCGVPAGGLHHFPCDREECPSCSLRILLCRCLANGPVPADVREQHLANQRDILKRQRGNSRAFGKWLRGR